MVAPTFMDEAVRCQGSARLRLSLVDSYRIQYSYLIDSAGAEYKAPWNKIYNNAVPAWPVS